MVGGITVGALFEDQKFWSETSGTHNNIKVA